MEDITFVGSKEWSCEGGTGCACFKDATDFTIKSVTPTPPKCS
jgi:hypothetical protein